MLIRNKIRRSHFFKEIFKKISEKQNTGSLENKSKDPKISREKKILLDKYTL